MPDSTSIVLDFQHDGKARAGVLTAKLGDETLAVERVDITHSKRRDEFVTQLTKDRPGIDAKAVEGELLKIAAEAAKPKVGDNAPTDSRGVSEAERRAALEMLRDPGLIRLIVDDIARLGVTGEKELAATVYLIGTSRLLDKPSAAIVQGLTSSGKSYVIDTVARLFPPEAVLEATSITQEALYYLPQGELSHRFVVAGERRRKQDDDAADATRALREMQSSGKLTKMVPQKVGGAFETVCIEQAGPIAYVESTTLQEIFAEDRNRCLILATDETAPQTRRVIDEAARRAEMVDSANVDDIIARHFAVQRLLYGCRVVIPFAKRLGRCFLCERTDARRQFGQLLAVISAVTLLHQYQRIDEPAEGASIAATADDYAIARRLLAGPFARSLGSGLSDAARHFGERLREQFEAREFDTRDIAKVEKTIGDIQTIRAYVHALAEQGMLEQTVPPAGPKPARYRLAEPVDDLVVSGLPNPSEVFPVENGSASTRHGLSSATATS